MAKQSRRPRTDRPEVPKIALCRTECAQAMGVSTRMIDQLIAGRRVNGFPVVYMGTKPLIPVDLVRTWLAESAQKKRGGGR